MIKKGFTLPEVLITMTIVGIIAAALAPTLKLFPDGTKVRYLKAYNVLCSMTNEIMEDPSLYYLTYNDDGTANCSGLNCTALPLIDKFRDIFKQGGLDDPELSEAERNALNAVQWSNFDSTAVKYGLCLASKLNIQEAFGTGLKVDDIVSEPDAEGNTTNDIEGVRFHTIDGILWEIWDGTVRIDLNDTDEPNQKFSLQQQNPDRFLFSISDAGDVSPDGQDALGTIYIRNPLVVNDKQEDLRKARLILDPTLE